MALQLDLSHLRCLVTGGTRGIGLAITEELLKAGARVYIASRKQAAVDEALASLSRFGDRCAGSTCNVGEPDDRQKLINSVTDRFGGLDVLVNNAAANPVFGKVEATEPWAFQKIMQVNLEAPFELAKLALPYLKQSEAASVLNISSIGGLRPEPKLGIYSVSKAALNSLTKVLAKEWGRYGIRVNAICPGLIQTDFSQALWQNEQLIQQMQHHTPQGRIGQPAEIGRLAVSIVSSFGSYCTGHIFTADGGYTI